MKDRIILLALVSLLSLPAYAETPGKTGFEAVKRCIMQNDTALCHQAVTPDSYPLMDRFMTYKLMPCLPTDFTYQSESMVNGFTVVKAEAPAPDNRRHIIKLAFSGAPSDLRLDIPSTLRMGLGENWQNKIQMAENLYLMIKANAGSDLTCDQLEGLIKK